MMMLARRSIPAIIPMNINIVDVRDVAESHVRALDMGEDGEILGHLGLDVDEGSRGRTKKIVSRA